LRGGGWRAGACFESIIPIVSGNITGAVGAGGSGGSNTGGNGSNGGDTTFIYNGTTITAGFGFGGAGMTVGASDVANAFELSAPGQGGSLSAIPTGSIGADGGDGHAGIAFGPFEPVATKSALGGHGGASFHGGSAQGGRVVGTAAGSNGTNGKATGSGGSGGARIATAASTGATGGAGQAGCLLIEEWSGPVPTLATIS
jgi:hypothetical protein